MDEIEYHFQQYKKALKKLKEGTSMDASQEIVRDGVIQRFEFTFELAWKLMKKICKFYGLEVNSPREAIKQCFQLDFFSDNKLWFDMIKDRNLTSHTYCTSLAVKIYEDTKKFVPLLEEFQEKVEIIVKKG